MNYISAAEAARLWGLSERSVRNYCAQGRVPGAVLIGKTWGIPSGTEKPRRANGRQTKKPSPLLLQLTEELDAGVHGGIYHKLQIELTYNSNHMEGSRLSKDQTRLIFETSTVGAIEGPIKVDDIVETANHFRCIDFCIRNALKPLSEGMVKEIHGLLKANTSDSFLSWFSVGDYKRRPNEVGGERTTAPEDVPGEMSGLFRSYKPREPHTLHQIIDFHVRFERIHPFQDGNGRVGRLIALKECLANGIVPFVIGDDMKLYYYRGLSEWDREPGFLTDTCLTGQDRFKRWLDYFRIPYESE